MPEIWPVIHLSTAELALENALIARSCGCTGVFVISMDGRDDLIDPIATRIRHETPGLLVGVNYLSLSAPAALERSLLGNFDATWSDAPGVRSDEIQAKAYAVELLLQRNPKHRFFGSVAFKYQVPDPNPARAARLASQLGMIATTSGEATGVAPPARKLALMRTALGESPLALASGVTPDNAYELGRFLSHVLVATGISSSFYEFDRQLLKELVKQLAD